MYSMEGSRGVRNLLKLVKILDTQYRDFDSFFEDNSGAIEAVVEWIKDRNVREWSENVKSVLHDNGEEED